VELIYLGLNPRFDISVVFTINYFFSERQRLYRSKTFLMTDFVNLKIKLIQFFRDAHRTRIYIYKYLYLYYISKKQQRLGQDSF
jgi:hypothetical protein